MLSDELEAAAKKTIRADRRKRKAARKATESVLCKAFHTFSAVGETPTTPVPIIGAPVIKDVKMRITKSPKVGGGRIRKKNKKAARRSIQIRQRQANRTAMEL